MGVINQVMGGSFDSREKVNEARQRNLAAQQPVNQLRIKKSSQNASR